MSIPTTRRVVVALPPGCGSAQDRDALVEAAARLAPAEAVYITGSADAAALAAHLTAYLQGEPALLLLPAGPSGVEIAASVAAAADGCSLGHCSALSVDGAAVVARRPAFGGRVALTLHSDARLVCAAIRPDAVAPGPSAAVVRRTEVVLDAPPAFACELVPAAHSHPRVEGAGLVVSGGRGIGDAQGFEQLARIATALGAGLGGSLPAVDAGWLPVAHQVGQSGKFVSPRLYFAVGISGTPQHLAGIAPQARIVALNSDRNAPIFAWADVGVEGDWRELLPRLAEHLESRDA